MLFAPSIPLPLRLQPNAATAIIPPTRLTPPHLPSRQYPLSCSQTRLTRLGGEPGTLTAEQFGAMNRADFDRAGVAADMVNRGKN